MEEGARAELGIRWSEVEPGRVETQAELRRQRPRLTPLAWRAMAEPQVCGAEVETGARQTGVEPVGERTTVEQEGRGGLLEPKAWKSMVQPG